MVQCQYSWIKKYEFIYADNACDAPTEFAILGVVSFCLTLLNIVLIIITGYSVNRVRLVNSEISIVSPLNVILVYPL